MSTIPESALKKRKTLEEIKARRAATAVASRKRRVASRKVIFKRAEQYAKEYSARQNQLIRMRRQARNQGTFFKADDPKVVLVVRIRGINRVDPKTRRVLQLLRLRRVHNATFVRLNKATENMVRMVETMVTYGPPSLKTVRELIYKRGFLKVNKDRIPITDNRLIEEQLGKFGIVCVEDLIHEIYTVGPHFKEANNALWPFALSSPLGGFNAKRRHFAEGGDAGNREEEINKLIARMN